MKTLKPFGIALFVVLVAILTSCSNSNNDELSETDMMFAKYMGNYSNITCRTYFTSEDDNEHKFYLLGIKNKHLWFSMFDSNGTLKQTWEDIEETDSVLTIDRGYGEYETLQIGSVYPYYDFDSNVDFYRKTDTGNIVLFRLKDSYGSHPSLTCGIFTSNNKSKHVIPAHPYYDSNKIYKWYGNSLFIGSDLLSYCCYSEEGDALYVSKISIGNYVPVSYEEGIVADGQAIRRNNLKTGNNVWTTECKAPFDIPTGSKPKYTSTLLDKSTDVWKYKVNMVYYDGTKKEFTFTININTGEYKASV